MNFSWLRMDGEPHRRHTIVGNIAEVSTCIWICSFVNVELAVLVTIEYTKINIIIYSEVDCCTVLSSSGVQDTGHLV